MPEPRQRIIVDGVDLASIFRFPILLRGVTGALHPPRLLVAFVAVAVVHLAGRAWDAVASPVEPFGVGPWAGFSSGPLVVIATGPERPSPWIETSVGWAAAHAPWFAFVFLPLAALWLALAAAAIGRLAAPDYGGGARIPLVDGLALVRGGATSVVGGVLLPALLVAGLAVPAAVLGLMLRVPVLDAVAGVLWIVALVPALLAGLIVVVSMLALPLIPAAVAVERCDALDAAQRAIAYVLQRPLKVAWWWLVGLAGWTALALVLEFVFDAAGVVVGAAASLAGPPPGADAGGVAAGGIAFWSAAVRLLITAYVLSAVASVAPGVFLLARQSVEGHDLDELWRPGLVPGTLVPTSSQRDRPEAPSTTRRIVDPTAKAATSPPPGADAGDDD